MKKLLRKSDKKELYYYLNSEKQIIDRTDPKTYSNGLTGDISNGLYGDISGLAGCIGSELIGNISSWLTGKISNNLFGDISELYGQISSGLTGNCSSELYGDISGLYGDIGGITGNISDCELTDEEREKGVNIQDLISSEPIKI